MPPRTVSDTASDKLTTKPQDADISNLKGGVNTDVSKSEDQKRAEGTDASAGAGEHDPSPAATAGQQSGGTVLATYAGNAAQATHGNIAGPTQPLIVGQAPDAPNTPMRGSENFGHRFHPDVPNPKMQSPMVRGTEGDPNVPTYADLRRKAVDDATKGDQPLEVQPVE